MTNAEVITAWRELPYVDQSWRVVPGHARAGHQGGVIAIAETIGRAVYIKPKKPFLPQRAAANEKLAADLATDLAVNVPPVVLTNPPSTGWDGQNLVCASLVMFGFQLHWGAAKHGIRNPPTHSDLPGETARGSILTDTAWGEALRLSAPRAASRALVLDTWVGQVDHNHPSNIAWGINPEDEEDNDLVFFDYEMAFGTGGWAPVKQPPFPVELLSMLDTEEVRSTVAMVESYSEDRLTETIDRIPGRFLADGDKAEIIRQLLDRRGLVRDALGV